MVLTPQIRVSQAAVRALATFPTAGVNATQGQVRVMTGGATKDVSVSQAVVRVVCRGRIDNRRVRAWTFSLDGHDFYGVRLGDDDTVVCDLKTGQWYDWNSPDLTFFRMVHSINWTTIGGQLVADHGTQTNIAAGDDTYGVLWLLDPDLGYDEHPRDGAEQAFVRKATGAIPMRMRDTVRCNEVYLLADKGNFTISVETPTVQLRTTDDAQQTWDDQGSITVVANDWSQEFAWRSLGVIGAPGRIFEITDNCLARIDTMDVR